MLALLMIAIHGTCWLYFEYLGFAKLFLDIPQQKLPASWHRIRFLVDSTFAMFFFKRAVFFAISVARLNWRVGREH